MQEMGCMTLGEVFRARAKNVKMLLRSAQCTSIASHHLSVPNIVGCPRQMYRLAIAQPLPFRPPDPECVKRLERSVVIRILCTSVYHLARTTRELDRPFGDPA
jgi:hypothetical protein